MVVLAAQLSKQGPILYQAGVMLEIIILGTTKASFHEIPFQKMVNYLFILPRILHRQDKVINDIVSHDETFRLDRTQHAKEQLKIF